jgi:hypothetical protein
LDFFFVSHLLFFSQSSSDAPLEKLLEQEATARVARKQASAGLP